MNGTVIPFNTDHRKEGLPVKNSLTIRFDNPKDVSTLLLLNRLKEPFEQIFWGTPLAASVINWLNDEYTDTVYAVLSHIPFDSQPFTWLLRAHLEHELEPGLRFLPARAASILEAAATDRHPEPELIAKWFFDITNFLEETHEDFGFFLDDATAEADLCVIFEQLTPSCSKVINTLWRLRNGKELGLACYLSHGTLAQWLSRFLIEHPSDAPCLVPMFLRPVTPTSRETIRRAFAQLGGDFTDRFLRKLGDEDRKEVIHLIFG